MMAEGMVEEALVLTRMIHDRYHARKRNPFNEIECSDHYARAMASYGTFLSACGFEYHGPKQYIRFAPQIGASNFRAPFTSAEGWGTFAQQKTSNQLVAELHVKYGKMSLKNISLDPSHLPAKAVVKLGEKVLSSSLKKMDEHWHVILKEPVVILAGQSLQVII